MVPQNLDAEMSVLGASMLTPNVIPGVSEIVRPHQFYRQAHQRIFEAIEDLFSEGSRWTPSRCARNWPTGRASRPSAGRAFVHSLVTAVPAATNARYYAEIVRENYFLRSLIRVGGEITEMGYRREQVPRRPHGPGRADGLRHLADPGDGGVLASRRAHHRELRRTGAGGQP